MNWMLIDNRLSDNLYWPIISLFYCFFSITLESFRSRPASKMRIETSARQIGAINIKALHWLLYTFPLSGRTKVAWAITSQNAVQIWQTLLEPRHKSLRLIVAVARIIFRRNPGKSLLGSTAGRIRTLIEPND